MIIGTSPCMHIFMNSLHMYWIGILFFFPILSFNQFLLFLLCQTFGHVLAFTGTYNEWSCSMYPTRICSNIHTCKILNFVANLCIFLSFFSFWSIFHQSCKGKYIYIVYVVCLYSHVKMATTTFHARLFSMLRRKSEASKITSVVCGRF